MSNFGFGGGGFGQNNNQQQSTFGGFGANNTTTNTGFGSTGTPGFGGTTTNTTGSMFGGGSTTGFGGGFGANNSGGAFGAAKPSGFGTSTTSGGGGLFGGTSTATAGTGGFGGFGQTPAATTSSFGGGNTGSSLFGGNKTTGFGGTTNTPAFGGGASTSGFSGMTGGAFAAPASTALPGGGAGECQGTGSVPFQAFLEKEPNTNTNQQNSFQSISFQVPYQKFSPEELRLADYTQGRRYGNQSNQPGAFGATNFTSFGSNSQAPASGFGGAASATGSTMFGGGSGFGTSQPQTTGFGGAATATGGGLFGATKPATSLFGAQQPAAQSAGGLFGGGGFGGGASGGFGSSNTATGTTSLFGGNTTANKPSGFSFGQTAPASTATGFGATPAVSGFGGGGLFGGTNNAQQPAASNPFGAQQQQPATTSTFGGFGGAAQQPSTSLFGGAQQQKPATGLFGQPAAAPAGGLFGAAQPSATNNPFGTAANNQPGGGSLFGATKPAAAATSSLFGGNTQTNTGGGGLFGNNFGGSQTQAQPQQTGGLFGGLGNNNQPKTGGLFGNQPQQQSGGGLFGGSIGTQQQGSGLFGGSANNNQQQQQQQPSQNSLFGGGSSLFGATPQQNQQQTSQALVASINDPAAFGNASLFASLIATENKNPGPLATPLSGSQRKKSAALPIYKLNPASSSRFSTPVKRGFGFSYSTYGSPASASSTASTPGGNPNNSLLGGSLSRGLSKSMSTSSLRRSFNTEDSILAPGAFSASPTARQFGSTGSIKKLVINRGLRGDLFSPPPKQQQAPAATPSNGGILKKRVSFDASSLSGTTNGSITNGTSSPLKQVHTNSTPTSQELGLLRPSASNGGKENGAGSPPEMEQVKNNELAIVHEEETASTSHSKSSAQSVGIKDQEPGIYWMNPSVAEIESMSNAQRRAVVGLTVGREGIGQVTFKEAVDLTKVDVRDICDGIVILAVRSCTVYPNTAKKPPRGHGLNVPSRISLMNSWPRSSRVVKSGSRMKKHVSQLQKVENTTFEGYDEKTGVWTFSVEHFTTYGLDYDDDETDVEDVDEFGQSTLSAPPDSPTPKSRTPQARDFDDSFASISQITESDPEDTFDFRKKKTLPGAFDDQNVYEDDEVMGERFEEQPEESFLGERSVGSQSEDGVEQSIEHDQALDWESANNEEVEMASSFPQIGNTAEQEYDSREDDDMDVVNEIPGGFAMARLTALKEATPLKRKFTAGNDWTSTLKTTISPQKQDRALLKSFIDIHGNDSRPDAEDDSKAVSKTRVVSDGRGFATSIDLMNSLFNQAGSPTKKAAKILAQPKGFEWPYSKRPKTADSDSKMSDIDRAFHDSMKPSWGPDGTLVYAGPSNPKPFGRSSRRAREKHGLLTIQKGVVVSERRNVQFSKFSNEASADALMKHIAMTVIDEHEGIPFATLTDFRLSDFVDERVSASPAASHEKLVWQLASVLWDKLDVPKELSNVPNIEERLRKKRLSLFWEKLVDSSSNNGIALARSGEEKAIASLSSHRVADACAHLINSKNFHLATLVALIGGRESLRKDIGEQLREWSAANCLSEFSQPIRALYELLAGNVCVCAGMKGSVEDRIDSFSISTRFGLDWRQAFGLRLWYGTQSAAEIEEAVLSFANDLIEERELAIPQPWYVEQKIPTLWEDGEIESREDLLWGLLRLYTFSDTDLEAVIRPENSQLSPLDTRLSWQLSRALLSLGSVNYLDEPEDKADRVTLSLASQLNNEGSWLEATFVLIHLSSGSARTKALRDHLAIHASLIGTEDSSSFAKLTQDFRIPARWIWEAKALLMRSVNKDPRGEVDCLLKAGLYEEAHRTFAKEVAPKAVIERNYDVLRVLLKGFKDKENAISEWHLGGEVYSDFLELLDSVKKGNPVDSIVLQQLFASLPAMSQASRNPHFMETVAIATISDEVAQMVISMREDDEKHDLHKILRLPLTEDRYLKHTMELSLGYYRGIMAGGR